MEHVARIIAADPVALEERVAEAVTQEPGECVVSRFTYWYTARPPVHEAVVLRRAA